MGKSSTSYRDIGLLVLRVGIGIMFVLHGQPKLFGGPEKWKEIGSAMSYLGINFMPEVWGLMAGFSEFVGGIFLILGVVFRPACVLLFITMLVASAKHLSMGDSFARSSHAIEAAILFFSLIFIGPGKYGLSKYQ